MRQLAARGEGGTQLALLICDDSLIISLALMCMYAHTQTQRWLILIAIMLVFVLMLSCVLVYVDMEEADARLVAVRSTVDEELETAINR